MGPVKKSSILTVLSPLRLIIFSFAPKVSSAGAESAEGTALQILPAIVPRFLTWGEAMLCAA